MKILKKILILLLVVFVIAQFFGPEKNDGDITSVKPFLQATNPPQDVMAVLKNSCFDCHSDHTRYPWYSKITPINYWMADHIEHGKRDFNMSKWDDYSDKQKDHKLEELAEEVREGHMPLPSYTWGHSDAKLSNEQIEAVEKWIKMARVFYIFSKEPQ